MRELDDITGAIVDASLKIHIDLGPGLLESVYEMVLARALDKRGFNVERQKGIRFEYDGMLFQDGFRADLLVEERVIVEIKSVEKLAPVHSKQLLTYLRLMKLPVGLLINFGATTLKEGLHRIVNNLPNSVSPREPTKIMSRGFPDFSQGSRGDAEGAESLGAQSNLGGFLSHAPLPLRHRDDRGCSCTVPTPRPRVSA